MSEIFFCDSSVYVWGSRNISTSRNKRFSHYPPDAQNHRSKKGIQKNIDVLNGQNYRGDKVEKLHLTNKELDDVP